MTDVGREPVQIVQIDQPFCANTFGVAPCTATGTSCYNTRATCKDTPNFAADTLPLYFGKGVVGERNIGVTYLIPSLVSVSTTPTKINLAGSNPDASGLGNRAVCSLVFRDHPHSDRVVDPYVTTRPFTASARASFWSKWIVRNKYRQNVKITVYDGYSDQNISAMQKRVYFLQSVSGPTAQGLVTITGKDVLTRLEERKSQAPAVSPGKLFVAIDDTVTSFEATNCTTADYSATGTLRIGDEIMKYSARTATANGVTFTISNRGSDNSTSKPHAINDTVQQCLRITSAAVDDVLDTLLRVYGGIGITFLDSAAWATEVAVYLPSYRLDALITKPTAVSDLVSMVQQQALCYVWWDERTAKVKLRAVRGIDAAPPVLTEEYHIIADSFGISEKPRERASRVWVYYAQQDFIKSPTDGGAYAQVQVVANIESEGADLYGEPSIRTIYANFLADGVLAANTATKIGTRYVDNPSICTFSLDAKDRDIWVGDIVQISHHMDVDQFGARRIRNWTIVSAEESRPGEIVSYLAEDTTLYGTVSYVMAAGAANYPGASLVPFKNGYIGNSSGKLSDGLTAARIS